MAEPRWCEFCGDPLPDDARANQKFCDADCRRGRARRPDLELVEDQPEPEWGPVEGALEEALAEAIEKKKLGVLDRATAQAARVLARKIDDEQARWDYCFEWQELWSDWLRRTEDDPDYDESPPTSPPKPPPMDNVSIPTFLRYAESLGLTPAGRGRIPGEKVKEAGGGSTLIGLTGGVPRPK